MTRETKIGLLFGLAFIVVFAVLLSHTGAPPGEPPATVMVESATPSATVLGNGIQKDIAKPLPLAIEAVTDASGTKPADVPQQPPVETFVTAGTPADPNLPNPAAFKPKPVGGNTELAEASSPRGEVPDASSLMSSIHRAAPPVEPVEPKPTDRPVEPVASAVPDASNVTTTMLVSNETTRTPSPQQATKEHIVQSKDSLYKIAEKYYKSGSPKYINMIVKANDLKDPNTVIQGQKLVIPLPADMFEGQIETHMAANPSKPKDLSLDEIERGLKSGKKSTKPGADKAVTGVVTAPKTPAGSDADKVVPVKAGADDELTVDLASMGSAKAGARGAVATKAGGNLKDAKGKESPVKDGKEAKPRERSRDGRSAKALVDKKERGDSGKDEELFRWYEIKPKDTLAKIAGDALDSPGKWQEIKKLNPGVDPQKMKPGERIKLPRTKPVSSSRETGRASA